LKDLPSSPVNAFCMKVTYCTGHERSSPHWCRIRSRSSGRALASAMSATGSPVRRTIKKIVALRMRSVTTLYSTRRMMNCDMPSGYWSFTLMSSQGYA